MAKSKNVSISDQLRRIFLDRQLSPTEVAEKSGVDRSVISRFLRDDTEDADPKRRATLSLASIDKLAYAYNLRLIEDDTPRAKGKGKRS